MKKYSMAMIPLLCGTAAPLCADNANSSSTKQKMEMNAITPSAEPAVPNCCSPFVTADFIWWKAGEDGLTYAVSGGAIGEMATQGQLYYPNFKFQPGFKVGFGLKFRHDGWDLYAQYTWLNSLSNSSSTSTTTAGSIVDTYNLVENFRVENASANWKLKFNAVDLELGRNFWISKWLTLRPHFGFKFSGIFQRMHLNYNGITFEHETGDVNVNYKNNEFGFGVRGGLDAKFYMNKYFSVYGDLAISAMWNRFHTSAIETDTSSTGAIIASGNVANTIFTVTPVLELGLGLSFEYPFHNDDYMWFLQAGWEEQIWVNQNQFPNLVNENKANLYFEGVTVETGFYF